MWVESQPIHKKTQEYFVIDAALGVVERGTWKVHDAVKPSSRGCPTARSPST
jgi:hypothetical protein